MKGINTVLPIRYKVIGIKKITISYPDEQFIWLEKHPEINRSGVFRQAISQLMKNDSSSLSGNDLEVISKEIEQKSL